MEKIIAILLIVNNTEKYFVNLSFFSYFLCLIDLYAKTDTVSNFIFIKFNNRDDCVILDIIIAVCCL